MTRVAFLCLACVVFAPSASAAQGRVIHSGGAWAAIDRGEACEAATRSLRIAAKGRAQSRAGFGFSADGKRWGEFRARLSRTIRPGSNVMLTVGQQPFLLTARGEWAWSRGPAQEQAIMAAVRTAGGMRIEARDAGGRRFADRYLLAGAPTAIDAAAARCAGKMR